MSQDYIKKQKAAGFKVGDRVKILCISDSNYRGWGNSWIPEMDEYVGKIGKITCDYSSSGLTVEVPGLSRFNFPYFVLEKVTVAPKKKEYVHGM